MASLLDVLNDPSALFILMIATGFIFIIIAAVPSLSVFILKNSTITLNKRQSIIVAAIGGVLIAIGLFGIVGLIQYENAQAQTVISKVEVDPDSPVLAFPNGTQLNITVVTENPHPNFFQKILQKILGEPEDPKYIFYLLGEGGSYRRGPIPEKNIYFKIFPADAGKKSIRVDAIGPYKKGENISFEREYIVSLPIDQPPKINNISYIPIGDRTKVVVDAEDPEDDNIYYNFTLIPFSSASPIQKLGESEDNTRILTPGENGIGKNELMVCIRDGDSKGPYASRRSICKYKDIII